MVRKEEISMGDQPQNGQTQVIQNIDNPQDQAAAQYVAAAVNHYQQEVQTMENQAQAQQQAQAIPVQVQVGEQQQESSWFNTSNAMKVGGGIVAGIAAKAMYDHFSEDRSAMAELTSAFADLA